MLCLVRLAILSRKQTIPGEKMEKRTGERRKVKTDYKRRNFNRREGVFYYERRAYLTDTNLYGNVYYAQYFDFIGEAREEFFKFLIGENYEAFMTLKLAMATVDASIKYKNEILLYDEIRIEVSIDEATRAKCYFDFKIFNAKTGKPHAFAKMTVGFTKDKKAIPIPDAFVQAAKTLNMI